MFITRVLLSIFLFCCTLPALSEVTPETRPNFLIIVADDLGFSDLGAFGGEIDTPHLDALAESGIKFTNFHALPTCSPTRAALLTGLDNHEAGLGSMAETLAPNQKGNSGYEGFLRTDNATLAELLLADDYRTHFSGKWHLGLQAEQAPHNRGFQTSFVLLEGLHNHFGRDLSGEAVGHPPTYLDEGEPVSGLPDDFYSSDYFATQLIDQLKAAKAGADSDKPFFAYLAFTAPHWPLHAPPETVAKYKGRYDAGYEALREQRLRRQVELSLLDDEGIPHAFDLAPRWDELSPEQRARSSRKMEVFAAMVDRMDENVGRVIAALKETGELENTYILFLSDNGAEAANVSALPAAAVAFLGIEGADNELDKIGGPTSFVSIGPGWAEAATAPLWRVKAYLTEGGTRVVSFLTGPGIEPELGTVFTSVMDVVPTFLDLAGVSHSGDRFADKTIKPVRGKSWVPWLTGEMDRVYAPDHAFGSELFGGRALRKGDWKLLDTGDGQWRLFNIARDPGEVEELSASEPERTASLIEAWEAYAREVGVVMPEAPRPTVNRPSGR